MKEYLWNQIIKKHGEDKVKKLVGTLADLTDGKKRMKRRK